MGTCVTEKGTAGLDVESARRWPSKAVFLDCLHTGYLGLHGKQEAGSLEASGGDVLKPLTCIQFPAGMRGSGAGHGVPNCDLSVNESLLCRPKMLRPADICYT